MQNEVLLPHKHADKQAGSQFRRQANRARKQNRRGTRKYREKEILTLQSTAGKAEEEPIEFRGKGDFVISSAKIQHPSLRLQRLEERMQEEGNNISSSFRQARDEREIFMKFDYLFFFERRNQTVDSFLRWRGRREESGVRGRGTQKGRQESDFSPEIKASADQASRSQDLGIVLCGHREKRDVRMNLPSEERARGQRKKVGIRGGGRRAGSLHSYTGIETKGAERTREPVSVCVSPAAAPLVLLEESMRCKRR